MIRSLLERIPLLRETAVQVGLGTLGLWLVLVACHWAFQVSGTSSGLAPQAMAFALALTAAVGLHTYRFQVRLQRAAFLRELTTKLLTDPALYSAYVDLVFRYYVSEYDEIVEIVERQAAAQKEPLRTPHFGGLDALQTDDTLTGGRRTAEAGNRRYHPLFFLGSKEESRLDALLKYLDMICYHIEERHLLEQEVEGSLGEILDLVANKPFITEYLMYVSGTVQIRNRPSAIGVFTTEVFEHLQRELDKRRKSINGRDCTFIGIRKALEDRSKKNGQGLYDVDNAALPPSKRPRSQRQST